MTLAVCAAAQVWHAELVDGQVWHVELVDGQVWHVELVGGQVWHVELVGAHVGQGLPNISGKCPKNGPNGDCC